MSKFILAFHGGSMPETPEEGQATMAKWGAWMQGLGAAMADPGAPLGMSKTMTGSAVIDDGGANPLSGYTVVTADTMEDAMKLAESCPIFDNGGTIEIAECMEM